MKFNLDGYLEAQGVNVAKLERRTIERVRELKQRMNAMAQEQTAWLVERRDMSMPHWLTWYAGGWSWTDDASEATKFADEKSASTVKNDPRLRYAFPVYVCEHMWPEGF